MREFFSRPGSREGLDRPLAGASFVVLDTELTGLDARRDSILSIGAVHMTGGRIDIGRSFYSLVKPETELRPSGVVIHAITREDLEQTPGIGQVLEEFGAFLGDSVIMGYCVDIDMEFLEKEMRRLLGRTPDNPVVDVYPVYEWARAKTHFAEATSMPERARLYDIARHYGIPVNGAHNALADAFITAQVFQRLIPVLSGAGITDVGELVGLYKRLKGGDRHRSSCGISNF